VSSYGMNTGSGVQEPHEPGRTDDHAQLATNTAPEWSNHHTDPLKELGAR